LVLRPSTAPPATCPRCGSGSLSRVMSRFTRIKSEDERLESLGDPDTFGDFDENDPASVGRFMKKMGKEFGDDLGDDFGDAIDEAMTESAAEETAGEASDADRGTGDDL
ncbi:MAG: FmdB family zinc ribbon protein, partial [Candidatus Rokuibacteriota bacterium]